jgi:hypothetical protein
MLSAKQNAHFRSSPHNLATTVLSVELASVYFEIRSRVEPTWDNAELDTYVTDLRCNI